MTTYRPFTDADLRTLAAYLVGTEEDVDIALSELGFDPHEHPEIREWLGGIGLTFNRKWHWELNT
jgi:hypothetical protein